MKRKVMTIALVVAIAAIIGSFTIAYFTDTDAQHNTMTIGNVDIEQIEKQFVYDDNGNVIGMEDFVQDKDIFPAATDPEWREELTWSDLDSTFPDKTQKIFVDEMNAVDKIVTVTNTGNNDVYFRTFVVLENYVDGDMDLHTVQNEKAYTYKFLGMIDYKGGDYAVLVFTHNDVLTPDETAAPCLSQVAMNKSATQEYAELYGESLDIYCFSQAVQTEGFDNADSALTAAFGAATASNAQTWATEFFGA